MPIATLQKAYDWYSFNVIPTIGEVMVDETLRDCTSWHTLHSPVNIRSLVSAE